MQLFLDNTGYHAIGRCIEGRATGESDLSNFLQFATQLVFSDTVGLSAWQPPAVAARSAQVTGYLRECGIERSIIPELSLPADGYVAAMTSAASRLSDELEFCFSPANLASEDVLMSTLPERNTLDSRFDGVLHRMISQPMPASERDALLHDALNARAAGWPICMVGHSESLQRALSRLQKATEWTEAHTANVIIYLRYFMNQEVAARLSGPTAQAPTVYSPSVSRARVVANASQFILDSLNGSLSEAVSEFEPLAVGAPSIATALVMRGHGEPHGILSEALKARDVAHPLRQMFSAILRHSTESVEAGRKARHELRLALADVGGALKQSFQPHDSPKFSDAIEFDFLGLGFIPNPLKVLPWLKHRRMLSRVTVLTEFAKTLTDFEANQYDYPRFYRNATKATTPDSKE